MNCDIWNSWQTLHSKIQQRALTSFRIKEMSWFQRFSKYGIRYGGSGPCVVPLKRSRVVFYYILSSVLCYFTPKNKKIVIHFNDQLNGYCFHSEIVYLASNQMLQYSSLFWLPYGFHIWRLFRPYFPMLLLKLFSF